MDPQGGCGVRGLGLTWDLDHGPLGVGKESCLHSQTTETDAAILHPYQTLKPKP